MRRFVILFLAAAGVASAQSSSQPVGVIRMPPPFKDRRLAEVLSFMTPGMGQVYADHTWKGALIFATTAAGIIIEATPKKCDPNDFSCTPKKSSGFGYVVAAGSWLFGIFTAGQDVDDHNHQVLQRAQGGAYGSPSPRPQRP